MSSYLTPAEKLSLGNEFLNLHDTFKRPIRMFKTAQETVIVTNPDYNEFFPSAPSNEIRTVIISGCFDARIQYAPKQDLSFLVSNTQGGATQNTLKSSEGIVRLKLDYSGSAYLNNAERVILDGSEFERLTDPRPHGLFVPNFYTHYLKRVDKPLLPA